MIRHDKASQYMPIWDIRGSLSGDVGNIYVGNIYYIYILYIYIIYIIYYIYIYVCYIYNMSRSKHELDSRIGGCFSID